MRRRVALGLLLAGPAAATSPLPPRVGACDFAPGAASLPPACQPVLAGFAEAWVARSAAAGRPLPIRILAQGEDAADAAAAARLAAARATALMQALQRLGVPEAAMAYAPQAPGRPDPAGRQVAALFQPE
jgi:hypothetical protein